MITSVCFVTPGIHNSNKLTFYKTGKIQKHPKAYISFFKQKLQIFIEQNLYFCLNFKTFKSMTLKL